MAFDRALTVAITAAFAGAGDDLIDFSAFNGRQGVITAASDQGYY